ncbi:MAG: ATP phosphoribosyltransferase [Anaerolineae bacterium]|nr:ATP phosphoribosyltransferase [Anaerolineae bacterium]
MNASEPQIRLALPSKGRMAEETLEFLDECGLRINKANPRQYSATIPALPQALVLFQRVRDIPISVAAGDIDLAITGYDVVTEVLGDAPREVIVIHDNLGYGGCDLVLAVPDTWADVDSVETLAMRAERSGGLRVATKHGNIVGRFFTERGVTNMQIVTADGTLEAAPTVGYADMIADISSTGTTLQENRLKIPSDGVILTSSAILLGNRKALEARQDILEATRFLLEFIEAYLRAQGQYMVFANMRGDTAEDIARRVLNQRGLGGLQGPTISPIITPDTSSGWWAINIIVPANRLYTAVEQIRNIGGSGVVVTPVRYIFDESPARYRQLLQELNKTEKGKA